MQAHVYGHLQHPTPDHISKMVQQQKQFGVDGIMWLGYGYQNYGNTFPVNNSESWKQAKKDHKSFKNTNIQKNKTDFALIRPYTVRSVRGKNINSADEFLTDYLVKTALLDLNLHYDVFEPLSCSQLNPEALKDYPLVLAEAGILDKKAIQPFLGNNVPVILLIEDAELNSEVMALLGIEKIFSEKSVQLLDKNLKFKLKRGIKPIHEIKNQPAAWQKENLIVVAKIPESNKLEFATKLLNLVTSSNK
jgi:hypothetical protein